MGLSTQDTFYIDPRVDGCDSLSSRAKRLGLKIKGFLGVGVTVCVAASTTSSLPSPVDGRAGDDAAAAAAGGAGHSRGRRLSRIHRMVTQAQAEPTAASGRQGYTSIADQARLLHAAVMSGQAFRVWLERQESDRGDTKPCAGADGKGKVAARPLISRGGQRAGTNRFKSQDHPRVVIKDLDDLEPDRVQAFPPELLRKCWLHTDAPPGICPFTPREQWDREVLRVKTKDAQQCGATKMGARTPAAGLQKPRRGGWCECCERQYIGTMSEHCSGDTHRAAVAADPNFAALLAFVDGTGAEGDSDLANSTDAGDQAKPTADASAAAATSGVTGDEVIVVRSELPGPLITTKRGGLAEGGKELLPLVAVNSKRETKSTKENSCLRGATSPFELREATGGCSSALPSSPRRSHKSDQQGEVILRSKPGATPDAAVIAPGALLSPEAPMKGVGGTPPSDEETGERRKDCRRSSPQAAAVDAVGTPATSIASIPCSQSGSSKRSVCSDESRVSAQVPNGMPSSLASCSPPSASSTRRNARRCDGGGRSSSNRDIACPASSASSSPSKAAQKNLVKHGAGKVPEDSGTYHSPPSGRKQRVDSKGTGQRHGSSPSRIAKGKAEPAPSPSPSSDEEQIEKRRQAKKRALALLSDSVGWASSVRGGTSARSGNRGRCSTENADVKGSTRSPLASSTAKNVGSCWSGSHSGSPPSLEGSTAQDGRVSKKRTRGHSGGVGGVPSTGSGSPHEGEGQCHHPTVAAAMEVSTTPGSGGDGRNGSSKPASTAARRRCDSLSRYASPFPENVRGGGRPKRARRSPEAGNCHAADDELVPSSALVVRNSSSRGSKRVRSSKRQLHSPSTASRMGLETTRDSFVDDEAGGNGTRGEGQRSSPVSSESSEKTRSIPRSLGSKFAESHAGVHGDDTSGMGGARTKHAVVGARGKVGQSGSGARANLADSSNGSVLPWPTRRNCLSSPGSFLSALS